MRIYTYNCEFPLVEMHPKMCISAVRIYTNFGVLPHAEIYSLLWIPTRKSVFPRTRICTVLSELPHVEIHKSMCKSAPAEIRFSPCGNSHEIVHSRMWKYTKNCGFPIMRKYSYFGVFPQAEIRAGKWISACQFKSGFVNFRREKRTGIHAFSGISTCGNTRGNVNSCVRKWSYVTNWS